MKSQVGITLIETLIYIAFFAFLIASLFGVTYQIIASTDQIDKQIVLAQESNFILRKLDWALIGAQTINAPSLNSSGTELKVTQYSGSVIDFTPDLANKAIDLLVGSSASLPLNSDNILVSNFSATTSQESLQPEKVMVGFSLAYKIDPANPQMFQLVKYLKQ